MEVHQFSTYAYVTKLKYCFYSLKYDLIKDFRFLLFFLLLLRFLALFLGCCTLSQIDEKFTRLWLMRDSSSSKYKSVNFPKHSFEVNKNNLKSEIS